MGIFKDQAIRLLRWPWPTPRQLAQELFAIFDSDDPITIDSPLTIERPEGQDLADALSRLPSPAGFVVNTKTENNQQVTNNGPVVHNGPVFHNGDTSFSNPVTFNSPVTFNQPITVNNTVVGGTPPAGGTPDDGGGLEPEERIEVTVRTLDGGTAVVEALSTEPPGDEGGEEPTMPSDVPDFQQVVAAVLSGGGQTYTVDLAAYADEGVIDSIPPQAVQIKLPYLLSEETLPAGFPIQVGIRVVSRAEDGTPTKYAYTAFVQVWAK